MKTVMKKRLSLLLIPLVFILTSCGPGDDKIMEAQKAYRELISAHNRTVEAHAEIQSPSLDEELAAMENEVRSLDSENLYDMSEDDLTAFTEHMNELRDRYGNYLVKIDEIKAAEAAGTTVQASFSLKNGTYITFTGLTLQKEGSEGSPTDVLSSLSPFEPEGELTGLSVYQDVDNTPWIMTLFSGTDSYELTIDPSSLDESGTTLTIVIENEDSDNLTLGLI